MQPFGHEELVNGKARVDKAGEEARSKLVREGVHTRCLRELLPSLASWHSSLFPVLLLYPLRSRCRSCFDTPITVTHLVINVPSSHWRPRSFAIILKISFGNMGPLLAAKLETTNHKVDLARLRHSWHLGQSQSKSPSRRYSNPNILRVHSSF